MKYSPAFGVVVATVYALSVIAAFAAGFLASGHQTDVLSRLSWMTTGGLLGLALFGAVCWISMRLAFLKPLHALRNGAAKMTGGDLSFEIDLGRKDAIGSLQEAIKESLGSVSGILRRVGEVTGRVAGASERIEKESGRVVGYTEKEASALLEISSSVEELNASIKGIGGSVEVLSATAQESAASMQEMTAGVQSVGSIVQELSDSAETTNTSIHELSLTLGNVARGAGELADVTDTTLTAVEQIIGSINAIEQQVRESARLSERVTTEASSAGVSSMEKSNGGMERIKGAVEHTAQALQVLGDRSEEIGKILTVIDDLTARIKLLALNAAILSAQSGEKGKGFSVVADEMKGLAEKTAASTGEIAALIAAVRGDVKSANDCMKEALVTVAEGAALSGEVSGAFGKVVESAHASSKMLLSIERITGEQAQSALLVSDSVQKVREMVGTMARATLKQTKGIEAIIQSAERIKDVSLHVQTCTDQQMETSRMIAKAVEAVSDHSRQIAKAIDEQRAGTDQIWKSVEQIKDIPRHSRDIAFGVNRTLREVVRDVELIQFEMGRFTLHREDPELIRLGIMPQESAVAMYKRYAPLAGYLSERLKRKVELRVAPNFEAALRDLAEGVTSLCSMTSMIYIEARKKFQADTLVCVQRDGKSWHHSVIVARSDARVGSVRELRGKSFAFVDEKAAAGYVIPRAMLLAEGVQLEDLGYYNFAGAHDEVAKAVLRGEFDAGGMMESTAKKYREQGLKVVKTSDKVPEWNICCGNLPAELKGALRQALLELDESTLEGAAVLQAIEAGCSGFAPSADSDHDGMRKMLHSVGLAA